MLDLLKRVRIRLGELSAALLIALPNILDQLGMIDLHPMLAPLFGEHKTGVLTTVLAVALAVMRPIVHLRDRDCH